MSVLIDYSSGAFAANKAQGVGTITAGTGTYNLAVASYDSVSFSVSVQEGSPEALFFKPDGTKMYVLGVNSDNVNEYDLSTSWDISSSSYIQNFSVASEEVGPSGLFFKPDGTKMYITGYIGDDVNEYDLSTAWDISSASYSQNFSIAGQVSTSRGISFKPDGTKMYISGATNDAIYEYSLSSAWDISTASYDQSFSVVTQDNAPEDLFFNPDGTKMFVVGDQTNTIYEYNLSTAWDISTASYNSVSFSVSTQETSPNGVFFKSDGSKMYVVGSSTDTIFQYSTGTATSLDISSGTYFNYTPTANTTFTFGNAPASGTAAGFALAVTGANAGETYDIANASYDSKSFSVASQDSEPHGFTFGDEGTKAYVAGHANDRVFQYTLTTAYDISTASYASKSFSTLSQENKLRNVRFSPDGSSMYIAGNQNNAVYQYTLSTNWDVSTASYANKSMSAATQSTYTTGFVFNNDGTKIIINDAYYNSNTAYEYILTTAYDVSTGSYNNASLLLTVAASNINNQEVVFNNDGTKMYVTDTANDNIHEFGLTTAFDLSTASYSSINFSVAAQGSSPTDIEFYSNGTKMIVIDSGNSTIYQYSTGSSATATFSYPASVEWPSGTAPDGPAIGETDVLVFLTDDGGTSYQGFQAGDAMS